jgi:hypothetical protein
VILRFVFFMAFSFLRRGAASANDTDNSLPFGKTDQQKTVLRHPDNDSLRSSSE